jgi:hypothetical protein
MIVPTKRGGKWSFKKMFKKVFIFINEVKETEIPESVTEVFFE